MTTTRRTILAAGLSAAAGLLILPGRLRAADEPPAFKPPAKAKFLLFLLVGQSNMAGRGKVEDEDRKAHPRVVTLDKAGHWVPAVDPIHFDKPNIAGVGLGTTFGKVVAEAHKDATVGLIPSAVGGTSIDEWDPAKPDGLYAAAVRRAKLAQKDGTLAGILWHQGEADSKKADAYAGKAVALFAAFRKDLSAADVPVVVGTIGDFNASGAAVNAVLRALPEKVPNCAVAETGGLGHKGDKVHFDSAAYREIGRRYAAKWAALAAKPAAPAGG